MFEEDENPEIKDYQSEEENEPNVLHHTETFVGTPYYISPEMLNNKIAGPFTDIWALGVIVCHMITGKNPFQNKVNLFEMI